MEPITLSVEAIIIILLVAFILGMMLGVSLSRPAS
jgi:hypothetical protein